MNTYYFNLFNGTGNAIDEEGTALSDDAAARAWAIQGIRSIVSEEAMAGKIDLHGRIEVNTRDGENVMTVYFEEAVHVHSVPVTLPGEEGPMSYD